MNRIILTKTVKNNKTYTVYALMDENGNYKDLQLLPEKDTIINNIYVARVNKILPGINAAFVTIAQNKSCYLSLNDAKNPVKCYGGIVAGKHWYWYQSWFNFVEEHCKKHKSWYL